MPSCHCGRRFEDPTALQQHQKSKGHCYCRECSQFFVHLDALEQHRSDLHSFPCGDCGQIFASLGDVQKHQRSRKHCFCLECDRFFVHREALGQHLQSSIHAVHFHCCDCDRDFVNQQALHQHLADKVHKSRSNLEALSFSLGKWVCEECDRDFADEKGLKQHRSSVIHEPLSNIKCIAHKRCKRRFTSPSAWLHHLESGNCPSKMTRDKLFSAVQSNDVHRLVTEDKAQEFTNIIKSDLSCITPRSNSIIFTPITDGSSDNFDFPSEPRTPQSGLLTPNSESSQPLQEHLPLAMRLTCSLCPPGRKSFSSLKALENHLSSPAHSTRLFHCPLSFAGLEADSKVSRSMKYFSTLSGLIQHLESGACVGGKTTFQKTVEFIECNLGKMGLQNLKLLT